MSNNKIPATEISSEANSTAQTNPTIEHPPSRGQPPLTSADQPASTSNVKTSLHPPSAGPHPPTDATHQTEQTVPIPTPSGEIDTSSSSKNTFVQRLNSSHLTQVKRMLSTTYSDTNSFIIIPTTETDETIHENQNPSVAKELKEDQKHLDNFPQRREYVFKKIAKTLLKKEAGWGLFDMNQSRLLAAALVIPPARDPGMNPSELKLERPEKDVGGSSHYVPLANLFTKKNPKQLLLLGPRLIKRIRTELRLFDTAMTVHQRPDIGFLYFFGDVRMEGCDEKAGTTEQSLVQPVNVNPVERMEEEETKKLMPVNILMKELWNRYPMMICAERYRDNKRFKLLLQNGFQEIDKVQGFHWRAGEKEKRKEKEGVMKEEGHEGVYESCFLSLMRGVYPSLKSVENDLRGVVPQKEVGGVISDPTTVIPPAVEYPIGSLHS